MNSWSVSVNENSFDSVGITKDCQDAVTEFIWNGLEASATEISVDILGGDLLTAPEIIIRDNGTGINHDTLHETLSRFHTPYILQSNIT